jgi:ABC-type lipoprotein release transport system permease subunit
MKKYLSTLHQRSPAHKKRFALIVSGGSTLLIFGVWAFVVFGGMNSTVSNDTQNKIVVANPQNEVSPFDDLKGGVANAVDAVKQQFDQVKESINSANIQNKYEEARDQALTN